jgi:hypothetical protein
MPPQPSIRFRLFRPPNHFSSASCSRPTPNIVEALFDCLIAGGRFGQVHQADLIDGVKCFALAGSAAEDGHFGDVAIHLVLDIIAILALRMSATAKQCACRQQRTGE